VLRHRLTVFWMLLLAATVVSVESVRGWLADSGETAAAMAVLVIAFIKVRIVGREFMELRRAPWAARLAFDAWVLVMCVALIFLYRRSAG
jgi:hypothetical protein